MRYYLIKKFWIVDPVIGGSSPPAPVVLLNIRQNHVRKMRSVLVMHECRVFHWFNLLSEAKRKYEKTNRPLTEEICNYPSI